MILQVFACKITQSPEKLSTVKFSHANLPRELSTHFTNGSLRQRAHERKIPLIRRIKGIFHAHAPKRETFPSDNSHCVIAGLPAVSGYFLSIKVTRSGHRSLCAPAANKFHSGKLTLARLKNFPILRWQQLNILTTTRSNHVY